MFIMPNAETDDDYVYAVCMHNVNKFYIAIAHPVHTMNTDLVAGAR